MARADAAAVARFASFEFTYIRTLRRTLYASVGSRTLISPFVLVFAPIRAQTAAVPVAEHTW